jgi:hypothetical protein
MITRDLLVASQFDHTVREYDGTTGAFVRVAASALGDPLGLVIGLDGNLLVSDGQTNQVKRYDRRSTRCMRQRSNASAREKPTGPTSSASR